MKLIAFGDSFVEGLIKEPKENSTKDRKSINFATQLVERHSMFDSVVNFGKRGSSNHSICFRVQQYIEQHSLDDSFLLIVLSSPHRKQEYNYINDDFVGVEYDTVTPDHLAYQKLMLQGIEYTLKKRCAKFLFVNSFYHDYDNILGSHDLEHWLNNAYQFNTLFDIITGDYCKSAQKPFVEDHSTTDISCNEYISACKHPSAKGHCLIADTLAPEIKKFI